MGTEHPQHWSACPRESGRCLWQIIQELRVRFLSNCISTGAMLSIYLNIYILKSFLPQKILIKNLN